MSEQEKIDAIHREKEMVMISRRAEEEAREHARLLLEWAEGKTLQKLVTGKWIEYLSNDLPAISDPSFWRIKPEPRQKWETGSASIGGNCYHTTFSAEEAAGWKSRGYTVTEWEEVLP